MGNVGRCNGTNRTNGHPKPYTEYLGLINYWIDETKLSEIGKKDDPAIRCAKPSPVGARGLWTECHLTCQVNNQLMSMMGKMGSAGWEWAGPVRRSTANGTRLMQYDVRAAFRSTSAC